MISTLLQKIKAKLMNPKYEGKNEEKNWCGNCRNEGKTTQRVEEQKESKINEDEKG